MNEMSICIKKDSNIFKNPTEYPPAEGGYFQQPSQYFSLSQGNNPLEWFQKQNNVAYGGPAYGGGPNLDYYRLPGTKYPGERMYPGGPLMNGDRYGKVMGNNIFQEGQTQNTRLNPDDLRNEWMQKYPPAKWNYGNASDLKTANVHFVNGKATWLYGNPKDKAKDCLYKSYLKLGWINELSNDTLQDYLKQDNLEDQVAFLNQYASHRGRIEDLDLQFQTGYQTMSYLENTNFTGILVIYPLDTPNEIGHAVPVIEGEIHWHLKDPADILKKINNIRLKFIV
jgi:hypothetical protein